MKLIILSLLRRLLCALVLKICYKEVVETRKRACRIGWASGDRERRWKKLNSHANGLSCSTLYIKQLTTLRNPEEK